MESGLNVVEVNAKLQGTDWLAIDNKDIGFSLVQLEGVINDGNDDLDLFSSTDSLPVLSAQEVAEGVKFVLATVDARSPDRVLTIKVLEIVKSQLAA